MLFEAQSRKTALVSEPGVIGKQPVVETAPKRELDSLKILSELRAKFTSLAQAPEVSQKMAMLTQEQFKKQTNLLKQNPLRNTLAKLLEENLSAFQFSTQENPDPTTLFKEAVSTLAKSINEIDFTLYFGSDEVSWADKDEARKAMFAKIHHSPVKLGRDDLISSTVGRFISKLKPKA